jgi:hypothetical protein
MRKALLVALASMWLLAACGGGDTSAGGSEPAAFNTPFSNEKVYPTFVSSEISVGPNRFLVGLLNDQDAPVGSPRVDMEIAFFDLERSTTESVARADMEWMWIVRPRVGLYRGEVSFDRPGKWGAEVSVAGNGLDETIRASFEVQHDSSTPGIGDKVPSSDTPTASGREAIARISTDPRPDPRFYELSVAEALRAHQPFVVVFATPKFCTSAVCGPMLDNVKAVARRHRDITFVHVEPYELPADPSRLEPVASAVDWGLPSEPWTFVVDARGRVAAKYEGALTQRELSAALTRLR